MSVPLTADERSRHLLLDSLLSRVHTRGEHSSSNIVRLSGFRP
jgi:hypothetical protein